MEVEVVTRPYARQLVAWARHRNQVLCLSADLTSSCELDDFRDAYPDRFLSLGMAEQNMIGVAAGLAREGFTPLVHTFGVFLTRRVYDQVAMSVAYPNLRVRLLGFLPGLTTPGGVTHQAIDDVALMRSLPNMTILDTGDATEVETVLDAADTVPGPVYCRVLRGEVPRLFPDPMRLDRVRVLSEGDDVCVVSSGICTEPAMRALKAVRDAGVSVTHLHAGTLKPFGDPVILDALRACRAGVITMENHSVIGGLGAAAAELLAGAGIGRRLLRMGLQDTFAHGGSRPYLLEHYGLSARHLVRRVEALLGGPLGIDEQALAPPEVPQPRPQTRAEAL
jgi:transketolase